MRAGAILIVVGVASAAHAQGKLDSSSVWFAPVLRTWFSDKMPLGGSDVYLGRLACSNKDITRFDATAEAFQLSGSRAFRITGRLELGALPEGLKVIDGAMGPKYFVHLEGYLFNLDGTLVWQKDGVPQSPWVEKIGSSVEFNVFGKYGGGFDGYTAVVLAWGEPILVEVTSDMRVVLGMKRFSMTSSGVSTSYKGPRPTGHPAAGVSGDSIPNRELNLQYERRNGSSGLTYTHVHGIAQEEKRQIFDALVRYEDRTGDDDGSRTAIGRKFGIPEDAVRAISEEALANKWPLPNM